MKHTSPAVIEPAAADHNEKGEDFDKSNWDDVANANLVMFEGKEVE